MLVLVILTRTSVGRSIFASGTSLMPSPVTHVSGYANGLEAPFICGIQSVLMEAWNAGDALALIGAAPSSFLGTGCATPPAVPLAGTGDLGVIVERTSKRVWLVKLDSGQPTHVRQCFARRLRTMPRHLRQTMTYDRGREMAEHQLLTQSLDMPIYFCNPYSPWQRGLVENTNGLLRQYFPKGTDFSTISAQRLIEVERELNDRPRKAHTFQSPSQVYSQLRCQTQV